jgi:hypothetical protein
MAQPDSQPPNKRYKSSTHPTLPTSPTVSAPDSEAQTQAFNNLLTLESEFDRLTEQCLEEQEALVLEYEAKKQPLYAQRREWIRAIPKFWTTVLENHPDLGTMLLPPLMIRVTFC